MKKKKVLKLGEREWGGASFGQKPEDKFREVDKGLSRQHHDGRMPTRNERESIENY